MRSLFLDGEREFTPTSRAEPRHAFPSLPPATFVYLAICMDVAILLGASLATYASAFSAPQSAGDAWIQFCAIAISGLGMLFIVRTHRVEIVADYRRFLLHFAQAWCLLLVTAALADAILLYGAPARVSSEFSVQVMALAAWLTIWGLSLAGARLVLATAFRYCVKREFITHDVVVLGATELAAQFIQRAAADRLGVRARAVFHDAFDGATPREIANLAVHGGIDDLLDYTARHGVSEIVIALPIEEEVRINTLLRRLSVQPLTVSILPGAMANRTSSVDAAPGELPGIRLLPLIRLPMDFHGRLIKGAFDRLVALFAIVFFSPVMLACAIGIKLTSPGKVFYLQQRVGYRNVEFTVFKFRSMHEGACNTGKLTVRDDPRVFAFGFLMRKLSLDELPQLFNVLRGDMSLVGPRPHMPDAKAAGMLYSDAVPEYPARHRVKPGITGWAQVSGWRGPTETLYQIEQRVLHDLHYIDNWSVWLDLKILVKTCLVGFFGKNAF